MKQFISKLLVTVILINGFFSFSVFAEDTMQLYNGGAKVELTCAIETINGENYINTKDLQKISIASNYYNECVKLTQYNINSSLVAYLGSNIVRVSGISLLYINPIIEKNNSVYVSLKLLAMIFASSYEVDEVNKIIYISVRDPEHRIINGKISLPNNEVAPAGGIDVTIFVGTISEGIYSNANNSDYMPQLGGFPVGEVPAVQNYNPKYIINKVSSSTFKIPEGEAGVMYSFDIGNPFEQIGVGYEITDDRYTSGFYYKEKTVSILNNNPYLEYYDNVNMTIIPKRIITGTITLPNHATQDIEYEISAFGEHNYSENSGIISKGSNSGSFTIYVPGVEDFYTLKAIFKDRLYANAEYNVDRAYIDIASDATGIELFADHVRSISGKIKLPNNMISYEDIEVEVIMQDADKPNAILCSQVVIIAQAESEATYSLTTVETVQNAIIFYRLNYPNNSFFRFGHYSSSGTYTNVNSAEIFDLSCIHEKTNIDIPLLQSKTLTVNVSLPNGMVADADISGSLYAIPIDGVPSLGEVPYPSTSIAIQSGQSSGSIITNMPIENGVKYQLFLTVNGDERFYPYVYYNEIATTSIRQNSTPIDRVIDRVDFTLLTKKTISGNIAYTNQTPGTTSFSLIAIPQVANTATDKIYFSISSDIYSTNVSLNYDMQLPSDVNNYVIGIMKSGVTGTIRYFTKDGLVENINDAEILNLDYDLEEVNFNYIDYDTITPIIIDSITNYDGEPFTIAGNFADSNGLIVNCRNISDFDKPNLRIYVALYDANNKLLYIKHYTKTFYRNSYKSVNMGFFYGGTYAFTKMKILIWDENLLPLADPYVIEENIIYF